jgi:DNA excision repair protein ERCC-2
MKKLLFPHEEMRNIQSDLITQISNCLEDGKSIIAHAPTGLGKTAASLAPALTYAIENKKTIFFLTSRHTQHLIAIETLKKIKQKHNTDFIISDIIGKKFMCLQPGVQTLFPSDFFEYCKNLREDGRCDFFNNTYETETKTLTIRSKTILDELKKLGTNTTKEVIEACENSNDQLCPYEISQQLAKQAKVIIADYYYIFNPDIMNPLLKRLGKELNDIIIIVDEAHNLPERIRELMTFRLTINMIDRAINEAKKFSFNETRYILNKIKTIIEDISSNLRNSENEMIITKDNFLEQVSKIDDYEKIIKDLSSIGDEIREKQKRSYIASIAEFLERWKGNDEGYIRYVKKEGLKHENTLICYRCLDPSILTSEIVNNAYSTIMMSGTLTPTSMYKDLIGFKKDKIIEKEYASPFPEKNRLCMIVPKTSTKFTMRNDEQFKKIAEVVAEIGNNINGNIAIFFPSYFLLSQVSKHLLILYEKTLFTEQSIMSNEEKHNMIERFKGYKEKGAALLAVASGSYGEGIDLPGDLLKGVIVVGLPLQKPDLETKELINYYDLKFKKGWDYGYLFPAFNKTLQNAGRCIRSKDDKGIIVFLDERYAWSNYFRCFPKDMGVVVKNNYVEEIIDFLW